MALWEPGWQGGDLSPVTASRCCPQVFICGPSPHWLLVTGRGALRLHPMGIDGPIDSFAPFHNVNCPRGFLYFNRQVDAWPKLPRTGAWNMSGPGNEALGDWGWGIQRWWG